MKIINMLARRADETFERDMEQALEVDEDFERACAESLAEPMKTPTERLREATENILLHLRKQDEAHDERIGDLNQKLADEREAKDENLAEIATIKRALASMDEPKTAKRKSRKPELIAAE